MYQKILVCLDGSSLAEQILPHAEAQATCFKVEVILIQIVPVKVPEIVESGPSYKAYQDAEKKAQELIKKAEVYLTGIASSLKGKGIEVNTVVVKGVNIGEAIVKYAEDNGINLIAMVSHGRSGLREVLLGSVAEYVFKNSGLPVLMIKAQKNGAR